MSSPKYIAGKPILNTQEIQDFNTSFESLFGVQASYGEVIKKIMKGKGIDYIEAETLTGLNRNLFYNLNSPNGKILKRFVISIAVGFRLDLKITEFLLESSGMRFNHNDRVDCAYIYILENHKGKDIEECNMILSQLGVPGNAMLGELERGAYQKHKK